MKSNDKAIFERKSRADAKTRNGASGENRVESSNVVRLGKNVSRKSNKGADGVSIPPRLHYNRFFFLRKRTRRPSSFFS
jgi:hypothetical protein